MTLKEIYQAVKAGTIQRDYQGHRIDSLWGKEDNFLERCEELKTLANIEEDSFYQKIFNRKEYQIGDQIILGLGHMRQCYKCGTYCHWTFQDDTLKLGETNCPYEILKPFQGEITVQDQLVFANFFPFVKDVPNKYAIDWDLSFFTGRENITNYKMQYNVAYGQMGNMSIGVFINDDKTSIIIGCPYMLEHRTDDIEMTEEEYEKAKNDPEMHKLHEHTMIGKISLALWRWEATDRATLNQYDPNWLKEQTNVVQLNVQKGKWYFTHYFDTDTSDDPLVYAKLKLQE